MLFLFSKIILVRTSKALSTPSPGDVEPKNTTSSQCRHVKVAVARCLSAVARLCSCLCLPLPNVAAAVACRCSRHCTAAFTCHSLPLQLPSPAVTAAVAICRLLLSSAPPDCRVIGHPLSLHRLPPPNGIIVTDIITISSPPPPAIVACHAVHHPLLLPPSLK